MVELSVRGEEEEEGLGILSSGGEREGGRRGAGKGSHQEVRRRRGGEGSLESSFESQWDIRWCCWVGEGGEGEREVYSSGGKEKIERTSSLEGGVEEEEGVGEVEGEEGGEGRGERVLILMARPFLRRLGELTMARMGLRTGLVVGFFACWWWWRCGCCC